MNLSKSSWCHRTFLPFCSTGAAVPEAKMIRDTLKISLIKLAAAQVSSSFATTAFRVQLQLLLPPRQYFKMYLPCIVIYLARATWHMGESLVEKIWMLSSEYGIVLRLGGDMKKSTEVLNLTVVHWYWLSTVPFKYYLSWIFYYVKTCFVSYLL